MWPHLALYMIKSKLSGNPKMLELKLERGINLLDIWTSQGSPHQHAVLESGLSVHICKRGKSTKCPLWFFSALLTCSLVKGPNFTGAELLYKTPRTELTCTFSYVFVQNLLQRKL